MEAHLKARRLRQHFFDHELFGEPAWDILLDLYVTAGRTNRPSVSEMCIAASVPATTALRHLVMLERRKMITRQPDQTDRRRVLIHLSPATKEALDRFADRLLETAPRATHI